MRGAIEKALKDLDGLGERAVRTRILGIEDDEEEKTDESPTEPEKKAEDDEEPDEDMKQKLIDLLSKE